MLALFAAATVAATAPDPTALSPAEALIRSMAPRTTLASKARYCEETVSARTAAAEPAPLRCRPAPYYVSAREGRQIPHVLLANRKGPPIELIDRQGRPCHLMRDTADPFARPRVAD